MSGFSPGFAPRRIATSGAEINLVTGGSGPPLLLLHGYPQTHLMWRNLAPRLAAEFTVVVPDLRGYGDSSKPPAGPDNSNYSKRALAQDQVETMATLGFERFMGKCVAKRRRRLSSPWSRLAQGQCRACEPRSAPGHVGDRAVPLGGPWWPCRTLRRLRPQPHRLQFMSQPP